MKNKTQKVTKSQEKLNLVLAVDKTYKKFREYSGLDTKRIKEIRTGKSKPTRSEVGKITNYQFTFKSGEIKPAQLSTYVGFTEEQIIAKMHAKTYSDTQNAWIDTLKAKNGKYVIANRRNGQPVYYYIIFKLDHQTGKTSVGHGFMVKQNVEGFLHMSDGSGHIKVTYQRDEKAYITEYMIFSVLTFDNLAKQVRDGWLYSTVENNFYELM